VISKCVRLIGERRFTDNFLFPYPGHPKCRIFVTHGGLHSSLEALNASVPLIGIPFFVDQRHNMAIVEYYEIGTTVNINHISEELPLKIDQVLNNPK